MLDALDNLTEEETGRRPARGPGDQERARALAQRWNELDCMEEDFVATIEWGWRDEWTRQRVLGPAGGVPTLAQYEGMARACAAAPKEICDVCRDAYIPNEIERDRIKRCAAHDRQAEFICPACRMEYDMEQAA